MNHVYRIIWNAASNRWAVASEFAKGCKKAGKSSRAVSLRGVVLALSLFGGAAAHAGVISTPVQAQNGTYTGTSTTSASATGEDSVAAGAGATASAQGTTALGGAAKASALNATAVGILSKASGEQSVALGWQAASSGTYAIAMGGNANAAGAQSIALGAVASTAVDAKNAIALGTYANASAANALALGSKSAATGDDSVAIGTNAVASATNSVALGAGSTTTANLASSAYNPGSSTLTGTAAVGEVSVGAAGKERRVTHVAAGSDLTDAVNVSQLKALNGKLDDVDAGAVHYDRNGDGSVNTGSIKLAGGAGGTKISNVANGAVNATSTDAVNGAQLHATNQQVTSNATNIANNTTAISNLGNSVSTLANTPITFASNNGSVDRKLGEMMAIQGKGTSPGSYSGVNLRTQIDGNGNMQLQMADNLVVSSVAAGNTALTYNGLSIAGGPSVTTSGINAGNKKISNVANGTADSDAATVGQLNAAASAASTDAVKYDDATHKRVTLGNTVSTDGGVTGGTKLSNVAQGQLSSTSTDAVNGTQLYTTNQQVATNTTNIANNSTRITNLDGRVTSVEGSVSNITNQINNGAVGLVQQSAAGANLTVGKSTDGVAVDFADKDGKTRTLKNVAAGADDTDAVNVSQLKATGLVDGNGNTLNAVTYDNAAKDSVTLGGAAATSPVKLKNVADGSDDTDAVNVRQLKSSGLVDSNGNTLDAVTYDAGSSRGVVTFGGGANGTLLTNVRDGAIAAGSRDAVNGGQIATLRDSLQGQITNIGNQVTTIDNRVTAVEANGGGNGGGAGGSLPYVDGNANGSSNNNASAGSTAGVAVGYNANATGNNAAALGQNATALGSNGTAVGGDSYAAGPNDTALGSHAKVHADGSVAVGANATVSSAAATNAVAVGANTQVSAASGTAVGQGASVTASAGGSVALGQGSMADRANSVSVGTSGGERQITHVAAGTQATDAVNVSQLQAAQAGSVRYDSNADGSVNNASVTMNAGGAATSIHNVAAGTATSDAVNVGQLNQGLSDAKDWAKSYTDQQVNQVNNRANAGVASAMAMASLPQAYQPNQSSAGVALGSFRGEQSMAVGVSTISESGRYIFKASATSNTRGDMGVGVGAGIVW